MKLLINKSYRYLRYGLDFNIEKPTEKNLISFSLEHISFLKNKIL